MQKRQYFTENTELIKGLQLLQNAEEIQINSNNKLNKELLQNKLHSWYFIYYLGEIHCTCDTHINMFTYQAISTHTQVCIVETFIETRYMGIPW